MKRTLGSTLQSLSARNPQFHVRHTGKRRWAGHLVPYWVSGHGSAQWRDAVRIYVYRPRGSFRFWIWTLILLVVAAAIFHELSTSTLQARIFHNLSSKLVYDVKPGRAREIVYPKDGPFDVRRGYTRLPEFERRLEAKGFVVQRQANFSRDLAKLAGWGITPPYREPNDVGLTIKGADGAPIFQAAAGDRLFLNYDSIPPLLVESLLYIENRELSLESQDAQRNPVVDWPRLGKATASYLGYKLGLPVRLQGGSTLATQIEKYRHSPAGRTDSGIEKLKQMLSASLKIYKDGPDTRIARQEIILDYLNTVPLAAVPGYGEVNGIGDGLHAWFGLELGDVCQELVHPRSALAQAVAFKHVLTLLASVRAPDLYLNQHHDELAAKVAYYTRLLEKEGVISQELSKNLEKVSITFPPHSKTGTGGFSLQTKLAGNMRNHLADLLRVPSLYDLDQLHLDVDTSIDTEMQERVARVFAQLRDPNYLSTHGLYGERLLLPGENLNQVTYSFLLFESLPMGNVLRAQVDNLDAPLDINEGVKLQLGSTAKLRVLSHYLELLVALHQEFAPLGPKALAQRAGQWRDPITSWAAETLIQNPGLSIDAFLEKAMDRSYSASPYEVFFTGGGQHTFENFDRNDNGRVLTIREATQRSVNLVFIRLMRDLVRFHEARLPYNMNEVLTDTSNPVRHRLLQEIADDDAKNQLETFYQKYRGLTADAAIAVLLGSRAGSDRHLAMLFFAWNPELRTQDPEGSLARWLQVRKLSETPEQIRRLARAYDNPRLTIADYGYLLARRPLEVWSAGQLVRNPAISWTDLLKRSSEARRISSAWLFQPRNRQAQDLRLNIRFEKDAFERMTPYWRRLGFPFDHLVPSYATAIGSSSDRPAALAELMGIIVNGGERRPRVRFQELRFAAHTPYETDFTNAPTRSERVMAAPVARLLRQVLSEVVDKGTANRVARAFIGPDGKPVVMGGKTGSGDNRFVAVGRGGIKISSRAVNRTATFVFYLGDRYFGVLTAFVNGSAANDFKFTSALPLAVLKTLAPAIEPRLFAVADNQQPAGKPAIVRW